MLRKWFLPLVFVLSATACATTDSQQAINLAQVTNTSVVRLIGTAEASGKITKKDGLNLLKQVDVAQEGIDLANGLPAGSEATDKLAQSRTVLKAVRDYLVLKGAK